MSEDEFDALPDDFAGIDFDGIAALSAPSLPAATQSSTAARARSVGDDGSSDYGVDDDIDTGTLEALDALERTFVPASASRSNSHASVVRTSSDASVQRAVPLVNSKYFAGPRSISQPSNSRPSGSSLSLKRSSTVSSPPAKRTRVDDTSFNTQMRNVLEGFEDEMTCPICCDIFASAYIANPCGHTTCGGCLLQWIAQAKPPTCPLCREKLDAGTPMIPNFSLDDMLEKHVRALGKSGAAGWAPGGAKLAEWAARKEACKEMMAKRRAAKPARKKKAAPQLAVFEAVAELMGDDPEDEDYASESQFLEVQALLGEDSSSSEDAEETEAEGSAAEASGPSTRVTRSNHRGRGRGRGNIQAQTRRGRGQAAAPSSARQRGRGRR